MIATNYVSEIHLSRSRKIRRARRPLPLNIAGSLLLRWKHDREQFAAFFAGLPKRARINPTGVELLEHRLRVCANPKIAAISRELTECFSCYSGIGLKQRLRDLGTSNLRFGFGRLIFSRSIRQLQCFRMRGSR